MQFTSEKSCGQRSEPRGVSGTLKVSPTGSIPHREKPAGKSPMTRSKPLGPSFASGSKHQREYGHGHASPDRSVETSNDQNQISQTQVHGDRDPPQFVIDRFLAGRQRALLFGSLEACSATPLVQNQSIANQLNKGGEFEDVLEATTPMLLEDLIEDGGFEQVRPQGQSRIGQGGPLKNHRTKKLPRQSKAGRQGFQKGLECRRQDGNRQLSHLRWLGRDRRAGPTIGITSPLRGRFRGSS